MTSASDTQVGGDHYKQLGEFQPWDVLRHWLTPEEYRGYQKGVAIAYLARERSKGGDEDIAKAVHHLQKLLEVVEESTWTKWTGGECPVEATEEVEVRLRDGKITILEAGALDWRHDRSTSDEDIVAYRTAALPF